MKHLIFSLLLLFATSLSAQEITGKWYAYPDMKSMRLRLNFEISENNGNYTTTLLIPDQSPKLYTTNQVTFENNTLSIAVLECDIVCEVQLQNNGEFKGTIHQSGYTFPLTLTRTPTLFKRPQTPKPPFPYYSEDITFYNPEGSIHLAGTISLPNKTDKFKAVILISGSGQQNRDCEMCEHKPFLIIADYLARHGIATLRFDDRGTAQSEGNFEQSSIPEFETDVKAAINYLKTRPEIQSDQIGVIGHSEGGFVALSLAAHHEVAFIITLAGGGVNGRELLLMQREALLKASGAKEDFIKNYNNYMRQAQNIAIQTATPAVCEQKLQQLFAGTPLDGHAKETATQLHNPGKLGLLMYDPEDDYPKINCPVLALNGTKDCQVPVANLEYIKKGITANGNTQVTTISYPNLNHLFQTANTGLPVEYCDIEESFSPAVLKDIVNWIQQQN